MELIRAVSILGDRRYGKASKGIASAVRRLLRRRDPHALAAAESFAPLRSEISLNDQQSPFPEMEQAAIAKFGDLMKGVEAGTIFPPKDLRSAPYIRDVYWLDRGVAETIESVYAQVAGGDGAARRSGALPERAWRRLRRWLQAPAH